MFGSPPSPSRIVKKLRDAIERCEYERVLHLLDRYAEVNLKGEIDAEGPNGESALCMAARRCGDPKVVEALLKAGADPNRRAANGWGPNLDLPLGNALESREHRREIMALLITYKADINLRNGQGETLLMTAPNSLRDIDLLLEMGADASLVDNSGQSALVHAARDWDANSSSKDLEGMTECLQRLIQAGADPWAVFGRKSTVLNTLELRQDLQPEDRLAVARGIVPEMFDLKLWKGKTETDVLEAWSRVPRAWRETGEAPLAALIRELRSEAPISSTPTVQVPVRARGGNPGALA